MEETQPKWRTEALRLFPELTHLGETDSCYTFWMELFSIFKESYEEPKNVSMIKRVYLFADWCMKQPRGLTAEDDLQTCVVVCFYEDIPGFMPAWDDLPNWLTRFQYEDMEDVFRYQRSEKEFEVLRKRLDLGVFRESELIIA